MSGINRRAAKIARMAAAGILTGAMLFTCANCEGVSTAETQETAAADSAAIESIVHEDVCIEAENRTLRGYLEGPEDMIHQGKTGTLVILMHGLMDSGEFQLIRMQADAYTAAGCAVLAVDFNGHGRSDGALIDMTVSSELEDAEAILDYAKKLTFADEIVLIGHSQGGVIASTLAARHTEDIDRLVLLAPAGMLSDKLRAGSCFGRSFDPQNPPEKSQVFDDYVGRAYIVNAMSLDPYAMAEGYRDRSVLLVAGGDDPLVSEETVHKYEEIYSREAYNNKVTYRLVENAPHDFYGLETTVTETVLGFINQ